MAEGRSVNHRNPYLGRLQALMIEDSPSDAALILRELRKAGFDLVYERVDTEAGVSAALAKENWNVVLSDYNLPGFSAMEALELLKKTNKDIPFILISGAVGEQTAVDLMKAGASDFIRKDNLSRLVPAIEREIREVKNRNERRRADARFRLLIEAIPQIVWILKADAGVEFYNRQWFEYTGFSSDHVGPYDWQEVIHQADLPGVLVRWNESVQEKKSFEMECRFRRSDGTYRWHLLRSAPIQNEAGDVTEWFGTCTDIEQQKQAVLMRDEFLSVASHELRTPITSLKLRLDMTRRAVRPTENKQPKPEELKRILDISLVQVERLILLVEDLLDVSRIQLGKLRFRPEPVDLSEVVKEIIDRYTDEFQVAKSPLTAKIEPHIIGYWDRSRIEQVIINLVSNAIKYAFGTPIEITVTREEEEAIYSIRDQGPGIPLERQSKIFERFERATSARNVSGLGLGLFIVDQIVKAHHGSVQLISDVGKGSTFIVRLPTDAMKNDYDHENQASA